MTTATFVRLIFFKDIRIARYPLLLQLIVLLGTVVFSLDHDQAAMAFGPSLWRMISLGGMALVTMAVVQSDPAGREFRFLLTRPVPSRAIGLAKLLFITLFAVIPYWLTMEIIVAGTGISLTPADHLLLLIETVVQCWTVLASAVLLSVFLPNIIAVLFTYVALYFLTIAMGIWWQQQFHTSVVYHWPDPETQHLEQFRSFLAEGVFIASSLFAVGLRYRTKGVKIPLAVAASGLALTSLCYFYFPYNLTKNLEDEANGRLNPDELARIHMNLVRPVGYQDRNQLSRGSWNGIQYVCFNQTVRFDGLGPNDYVRTVTYHAVVTLRSGQTFTSDFGDYNSHGVIGGMSPLFLAKVAGVLPPWPYQQERQDLDLLTFMPKNFPADEDFTGATIKGVITLEVRRAYIAATLPLKTHASFSWLRQRYEITQTDFSSDGVDLGMKTIQLPLKLRGDLAALQWLAIYRPFGEELEQTGSSGSGGTAFGVQVLQSGFSYKSGSKLVIPAWRELPPDWASGAQLVFIGSDSCGQITCPYEIDNVDLHFHN